MRSLITPPVGRAGRPAAPRRLLLAAPLADELFWSLPVLALPLLRGDLGLTYAQAGLLFTVGELSALLFEPPLNLLSDRRSKRAPVLLGLLTLAAGSLLAGGATSYLAMLAAFALLYPASGAAVGLAQATLIDGDLEGAPRTMTRWTLSASVGDLLGPPLVAAALAAGLGWRPLFWVAAAGWAGFAAALWRRSFPTPPREDTDPEPAAGEGKLTALQRMLRSPGLLRWVAVVLLSSALDEIFLAWTALYLGEAVGLAPAAVSLAVGAGVAGSAVGLFALDRLLGRASPGRLVRATTLLASVGVAALLFANSAWAASVSLFAVGLGASSWYPLGQAGAYAALPGRSGAVRALMGVLGAPFGLALPAVVGLTSDRFGVGAGLALLSLAPLCVLAVAPGSRSGAPPSASADP
jgi:FSR family fosmidomycin resistance protein-like MFS transporter